MWKPTDKALSNLAKYRHLGPAASITHGRTHSRAYRAWDAMIQRCTNPKNASYKNYGGRGITVCPRWLKFNNFFMDMGDPPPGKMLERENNDLGYDLGNCRWATPKEQSNNKRSNRRLTFDGQTLNLKQWSELKGIGYWTLCSRIRDGWSLANALSVPVGAPRGVYGPQRSKA